VRRQTSPKTRREQKTEKFFIWWTFPEALR
jgi:hypothetical protein